MCVFVYVARFIDRELLERLPQQRAAWQAKVGGVQHTRAHTRTHTVLICMILFEELQLCIYEAASCLSGKAMGSIAFGTIFLLLPPHPAPTDQKQSTRPDAHIGRHKR